MKFFSRVSIVVLVTVLAYAEALFCYQCLSLNCISKNRTACDNMQAFAQNELRHFYNYKKNLTICPSTWQKENWQNMENSDEPCPEPASGGRATCAIGLIQIRSFKIKKEDFSIKVLNHGYGVILGCQKLELTALTKAAHEKDRCWKNVIQYPFRGVMYRLRVDHCGGKKNQCNEDYCITRSHPYLKKLSKTEGNYSSRNLIISIIIFTPFIKTVIRSAAMCVAQILLLLL